MAVEKKKVKRTRKAPEPLVETVLEELNYTTSTSSMASGDLRNGGGAGSITNVGHQDKKGKPRGKGSKIQSTEAMSTNVDSVKISSQGQTQTRGRSSGKANDSKSNRPYSSCRGVKRPIYDVEAEEGEEEDEEEEEEEDDDEGEFFEDGEDEYDETATDEQTKQNQGHDLYCNDQVSGSGFNGNHGKEFEVNYNVAQEGNAYAISVDHDIRTQSTVRPPIGAFVASKDMYRKLSHQQISHQTTGSYASSFSPSKVQQESKTSFGVGSSTSAPSNMVRQPTTSGSNDSSRYKASTQISASSLDHATLPLNREGIINSSQYNASTHNPLPTGIHATLPLNGEVTMSSTTSSPIGEGITTSQTRPMYNHSPSTQVMLQKKSPIQLNQQSHIQTSSSPYSTYSAKDPLRPKLIALYTVAMNALDSVTTDLQTKLGYEQANTAIVSLLNETTGYYKAVYIGETPALKPPTNSKESFADAILKSGNLLGEYKVMFREHEAATAAQSSASAQLKLAYAQKQLIESKLLHIKSRLQQLQFDAGK